MIQKRLQWDNIRHMELYLNTLIHNYPQKEAMSPNETNQLQWAILNKNEGEIDKMSYYEPKTATIMSYELQSTIMKKKNIMRHNGLQWGTVNYNKSQCQDEVECITIIKNEY